MSAVKLNLRAQLQYTRAAAVEPKEKKSGEVRETLFSFLSSKKRSRGLLFPNDVQPLLSFHYTKMKKPPLRPQGLQSARIDVIPHVPRSLLYLFFFPPLFCHLQSTIKLS